MKKTLNNFKYLIFGIILAVAITVHAAQISVPSANGSGFFLQSSTTGQYLPVSLTAGSNITIATTSSNVTISASGGSGSFPFDVSTNYNSTSTTIGFLNGLFSTASSTFSGNLFLTSGFANGLLYTGTKGLVQTVATTSATCAGTLSCTAFTVLGSAPITLTGSGSSGFGEAWTLGTNIFSQSMLAPTTTQNIHVSGTGTSTFIGGLEAWRQIAFPYFHATSTTATSTIANGLRLGNTAATRDNLLQVDCSGRSYPASITVGGCVSIDGGTTNQGTLLFVHQNTNAVGTGRMVNFIQDNTTVTQDMWLASSSCANCTALNLKGFPTGKGILKIEATGSGTGFSNSSAVSLDLANETDAQGIFIKGAVSGTGKLTNWVDSNSSTLGFFDSNGLFNSKYSSSTVYSSFLTASSTFLNAGSFTLATTSAGCASITSAGLLFSTGVACASGGSFTNTIANGGTGSTSFAPNSIITSNAAGTALIATTSNLYVTSLFATSTTATSTFSGNVSITDGTNWGFVTGAHPFQIAGTVNLPFQQTIVNKSTGGNAMSGYDLANANSTNPANPFAATYYGGLFMAGSGFNLYPGLQPNDVVLVNSDAQVSIASLSSTTGAVNFAVNAGYTSANWDARLLGIPSNGTASFIVGTTTGAGYTTIFNSTTTSQLSLANGTGIPQWTFRNAGGNLYVSTTTVAGTATTTTAALSLLNTGEVIVRNLFQVFSTTGTKVLGLVGNVFTLLGTWDFSGATVVEHTYKSFSLATTTAWTATSTTRQIYTAVVKTTVNSATCNNDAGTLNIQFYSNQGPSNLKMNMLNLTTGTTTQTLSSNNVLPAGTKLLFDAGTPASSPTQVSCTVDMTLNQ